MNDPTAVALLFAAGLGLFGLLTGAAQVRGWRRLLARRHVPSDELAYLRGRYRRRLLSAGVVLVIAGLIAGAYLSGMEDRANDLARPRPGDAPRGPLADADKQFLRLWGVYWIGVVGLVFALVGLALADVWANRRYWLLQYRRMKDEHQTKLRRDLAVYQAQKPGRGRLGRPDE